MVEDYKIEMRNGRAEGTGQYEITRRKTRREITRFVERYKTPVGEFKPEDWKKQAMASIEAEGETALLKSIKEYCGKHCAWLHTEEDLEEYAIDCLCSRAYRHWDDFENNDEIIWM